MKLLAITSGDLTQLVWGGAMLMVVFVGIVTESTRHFLRWKSERRERREVK